MDLSPGATAPEIVRTLDLSELHLNLRRQGEVFPAEFGGSEVWLVTGYNQVRAALQDPRLSSDWKQAGVFDDVVAMPEDVAEYFDNEMVALDGRDHTRLRTLVSREFAPRRLAAIRPRVQEIVDGLLEELDMLDMRRGVDLVEHYANKAPAAVLSELLGIEREHQDDLAQCIRDLIETRPEVRRERVPAAARRLVRIIRELIHRRRADPGDDLVSALARVQGEGSGRLSESELIALIMLIVRAGYETTGNSIATGILLLLMELDAAERAAVVEDRERLRRTFEEVLRYAGPADMLIRYSLAEIPYADRAIPAGVPVVLCCGAANRDARPFTSPDDFEPAGREAAHLAFGHGVHFCLGASLARLEAEIAIGSLFRRWPLLEPVPDQPPLAWRPSMMRGLKSLYVRQATT